MSGFIHTGAVIPLLLATVSDAMVGVEASRFLPREGPGPAGDWPKKEQDGGHTTTWGPGPDNNCSIGTRWRPCHHVETRPGRSLTQKEQDGGLTATWGPGPVVDCLRKIKMAAVPPRGVPFGLGLPLL